MVDKYRLVMLSRTICACVISVRMSHDKRLLGNLLDTSVWRQTDKRSVFRTSVAASFARTGSGCICANTLLISASDSLMLNKPHRRWRHDDAAGTKSVSSSRRFSASARAPAARMGNDFENVFLLHLFSYAYGTDHRWFSDYLLHHDSA